MNKTIVFISIPTNGKDDTLIERSIQIAKRGYLQITKQNIKDVAFVHNHDGYEQIQAPDGANEFVICLGEAIKKMGLCDAVIFGKGWEKDKKCKIEHDVCVQYGVNFIEMN